MLVVKYTIICDKYFKTLELRGFCIPFIESFKRWSAFASHTQNKQQEPKNVDLSAPTSLAPIRLLNVAWAFFN